MHVHINGVIYNLNNFDSCFPRDKGGHYPYRIEFIRNGEVTEYAPVDSKEELDKVWREMVQRVRF